MDCAMASTTDVWVLAPKVSIFSFVFEAFLNEPCALAECGMPERNPVPYPDDMTGTCSCGIRKLGISGTIETRLSRGGDLLRRLSLLAIDEAGESAGPDLVLRSDGFITLLAPLVGEALLLALELRPPSLVDFPTLAELYLTGIGTGGRVLSPDPKEESELLA